MLTFCEPDVLVVDVEDEPLPRRRSITQDLTLYVHSDSGAWHRKAIGGLTTACGEPIVRGAALMHERYVGYLCPRCFTPYELALAAAADKKRKDEADDF